MLLAIVTPPSSAQAAGRTVSSPVHLKINDYYVLYTSPAPPFIDENNRLMVPLRAVGDLLGASVSYDPKTKTAVVAFDQDTLQLAIGSTKARVNGQALEMDTVPVMVRQSMFIPAKVLMKAFRIAGEWDRTHRILTLKDDRFSNAAIEYFRDAELKDPSVSDQVLVPLSFDLQYEISDFELDGEILSWLDHRINITMRNTEYRAFPAEEVDIRVLTSLVDGYYSISHHYREPVGAGEQFDITFDGSGGGSWNTDDIRFIAVFARLLPGSPQP